MLSLKHNFLFIHLPKTGGNSLQNVLSQYSEDKLVCLNELQDGIERFEVRNKFSKLHKHSDLKTYQSVLEWDEFSRLFKFSTIRNPWERMISFYFSPHRQITQWNRNDFIKLTNQVRPLSDMLSLDCVDSNWEKNVDFILRFERLADDFKALCLKLDIPYQPLVKRNKSLVNNIDYKKYYDNELIEIVRERFEDDIAIGRYSFAGK